MFIHYDGSCIPDIVVGYFTVYVITTVSNVLVPTRLSKATIPTSHPDELIRDLLHGLQIPHTHTRTIFVQAAVHSIFHNPSTIDGFADGNVLSLSAVIVPR